VRIEPVAKRYAEALFKAKSARLLETERELFYISSVLLAHLQIERIMKNPDIELTEKKRLLARLFPECSEESLSLLYLLTERERLKILPQIAESFSDLVNRAKNRLSVTFITAIQPKRETIERLAAKLSKIFGCDVVVKRELSPEIVGGGILVIGDRRIDGSIEGALKALRRMICQR
jgi:F-type H+-transporting ATPase subunit delta